MKIRTFILATCAVLAIVLPAAAGAAAVGAGSIVPGQPVRQLQADNQQTAKLKALEAKIRALTAKNLSLTAKGKSVSAKNKSLTAKNKALIEQVYALWSEIRALHDVISPPPPPPRQLTPHEECIYSGNSCTAGELCEYWGMNCDQVPQPEVAVANDNASETPPVEETQLANSTHNGAAAEAAQGEPAFVDTTLASWYETRSASRLASRPCCRRDLRPSGESGSPSRSHRVCGLDATVAGGSRLASSAAGTLAFCVDLAVAARLYRAGATRIVGTAAPTTPANVLAASKAAGAR